MDVVQNKKTKSAPSLLGMLVAAVVILTGIFLWMFLKPQASSAALGKLEGDMHSLLFTSDGRVVYGQHGGIQISSDGGKTWSTPSGQGDAMGLGAAQKNVLYLAGHDVFQKSLDGGKTWTNPGFGNLPGTDIHGFAVSPESNWLYANLAGKGLYRSTDGAQTWQPISMATGGAMALAAGAGTPPALFAPRWKVSSARATVGRVGQRSPIPRVWLAWHWQSIKRPTRSTPPRALVWFAPTTLVNPGRNSEVLVRRLH